MSKTVQSEQPDTIEDNQVIEFLKNTPDFLIRNPSVLESLEVSQGITGATSLLERQTSVLRSKNKQLEGQLDALITAARSNEQIMTKLHHLTLELLRADSLDMLLSTSQDVLRSDFNADFVSFRLFHDKDEDDLPGLHFVKGDHEVMQAFHGLLDNLKPVCGTCPEEQLSFLFDENSSRIESVALVPLQGNHSIGLLALGSTEAERFNKGMGTVFLNHLGELIATAISQHLEH
ncbi:DUF484 family protein [Leucothrix arctica]|uniref:DUF484 domain-containing protein n=1 Tax=Leucothrix arctica TaxID=1481894 RepID=A0A317CFD7_9GAMM|nr:DUF484 family protein [Leucothrix arctica]PWQ97344.1 DUF484 domain-containing protein [Leucothrix arctica]